MIFKRLGALGIVLLGITHCQAPAPLLLPSLPIYAWPSDGIDGLPPSRVLVLPFEDRVGFSEETRRVRNAVVSALRSRARFDVVVVEPEDIRHLPPASFNGSEASTEFFVEMAKVFGVDGVIRGDLTALQPYREPALGLRLELWSLRDGLRLWRAEGILDTADERVVAHLRRYRRGQNFQVEEPELSVEDVRRSLARLYIFAAESLVERL